MLRLLLESCLNHPRLGAETSIIMCCHLMKLQKETISLFILINRYLFGGADVSTDGKWCYLVFWVVGKPTTRWNLLRKRLLEVCPTCTPSASGIFYFIPEFQQPKPPEIFLLKFWCSYDRKGLLHGTHPLDEKKTFEGSS